MLARIQIVVMIVFLLISTSHIIYAKDDFTLSEIAPGIYVHYGLHEEMTEENLGDIANIGFIVGNQQVAVIDTGGSPAIGHALREAIKEITELPIGYIIQTHVHPDHTFGTSAFYKDNAKIIGHNKITNAILQRSEFYLQSLARDMGNVAATANISQPDISVHQVQTVDLGDRVLKLTAFQTAHTDHDLVVYDEKTKTLWTGDLLFRERVPVIDGNTRGWLRALETLGSLDANWIVPGHGPATDDWPNALTPQIQYLKILITDCQSALQQRKTLQEAVNTVAIDQRGKWKLFDIYHPRNVAKTFTQLEWE